MPRREVMNRRKLFGWLAAAPLATIAAKEVVTVTAPAAAVANVGPLVGDMRFISVPDYGSGSHTHTITPAINSTHTLTQSWIPAKPAIQVWDGARWVDFNSPEGVALVRWQQ